jgi:hypothetical protein
VILRYDRIGIEIQKLRRDAGFGDGLDSRAV